MKLKYILFVAVLMTLASHSWAENWTNEQQEVLAFAEACLATTSANEAMACFDDDYVGWAMFSVPLTKEDRRKEFEDAYENFDWEVMLFKPLAVTVRGDLAVISYIITTKNTDKRTEEVSYSTSRWTDVLAKEGGKWGYISDHGTGAPSD